MPGDTLNSGDTSAREAMERLNESNRILVEARMLPRAKSLSVEQIDQVTQRVRSYTNDRGIKLAQIARECGYSATVISEVLGNTYRGNVDKVIHAMNDWMERDCRRSLARTPKDFVPTRVAEAIQTIVNQADKRCMMAAIVVPAGAGKTKVLQILNEQMRGIYIYCDEQLRAGELLRLIARSLGKEFGSVGLSAIRRWVIDNLLGTNRILFLDEAHQLNRKTLNTVRSIHDQAKVPVVMAGTAEIMDHLNDRTDGRGQFSSRCLFYNAMDEARNIETPGGGSSSGNDLFSLDEIKAFFSMKKIRLSTDALDLLWRLACLPNHGTLRLIENTVETVRDMMPESEEIMRRDVLLALRLMVGKQSAYLQKLADSHLDLSRAEVA
jgi:DNA transposition AAA+ family ATPase